MSPRQRAIKWINEHEVSTARERNELAQLPSVQLAAYILGVESEVFAGEIVSARVRDGAQVLRGNEYR